MGHVFKPIAPALAALAIIVGAVSPAIAQSNEPTPRGNDILLGGDVADPDRSPPTPTERLAAATRLQISDINTDNLTRVDFAGGSLRSAGQKRWRLYDSGGHDTGEDFVEFRTDANTVGIASQDRRVELIIDLGTRNVMIRRGSGPLIRYASIGLFYRNANSGENAKIDPPVLPAVGVPPGSPPQTPSGVSPANLTLVRMADGSSFAWIKDQAWVERDSNGQTRRELAQISENQFTVNLRDMRTGEFVTLDVANDVVTRGMSVGRMGNPAPAFEFLRYAGPPEVLHLDATYNKMDWAGKTYAGTNITRANSKYGVFVAQGNGVWVLHQKPDAKVGDSVYVTQRFTESLNEPDVLGLRAIDTKLQYRIYLRRGEVVSAVGRQTFGRPKELFDVSSAPQWKLSSDRGTATVLNQPVARTPAVAKTTTPASPQPPVWPWPGVTGNNVKQVNYASGAYHYQGNSNWALFLGGGRTPTYTYREVTRTNDFVDLAGTGTYAQVRVRLDLKNKKIMNATNGAALANYATITAVSVTQPQQAQTNRNASGQQPRKPANTITTNGRNLILAEYASGQFKQDDTGTGWKLYSKMGQLSRSYAEQRRDDTSVYLFDKQNNEEIRLDATNRKIWQRRPGGDWRLVGEMMSVKAR